MTYHWNSNTNDKQIEEIKSLKEQIQKLNVENEQLKEDVVIKDIRWGLVGNRINYCWLWTAMTEKYDGDDEYDFSQDLGKQHSIQSSNISWKELDICKELGNKIEKHINCGKGEEFEDYVNDAISELAELYKKSTLLP
jgi:hypothetical protein